MSTWLSFFINLHHYTGITPKLGCTDLEVDKNWDKCLIFVYQTLRNWGARTWK